MSKKYGGQISFDPPARLEKDQVVAKVVQLKGSALFMVVENNGQELLVEMPPKYRNKIWVRRNGFVIVDKSEFLEKDNKIDGTILYVVQSPLKNWKKQIYW